MPSAKVVVHALPTDRSTAAPKRVIDERGELAVLHPDGCVFNPIYFELHPGNGFFRGGHYHERKVEHFYLIEGVLVLRYKDLDSGDEESIRLQRGDLVTVAPRCAHRIGALETCRAIEYSTTEYTHPDDDYPYAFPGSEG